MIKPIFTGSIHSFLSLLGTILLMHLTLNKIILYTGHYPNPLYYEKTLNTGYIPPEAFPYLDSNGYIQDVNNIPVIFHVPRHKNIKKILYTPGLNGLASNNNLKYSMALSNKDKNDTHRKNTKRYWWLQ